MPEQPAVTPYAIQYSEAGKASRKELPPETLALLLEILDALAANPDAFPGRTSRIGGGGSLRLYKHPSPALQITFEVDEARRVLSLWHFVVPKVQITKPVFISYSHKDTPWLDKLKLFLKPLEDRELIRVWDDTEIHPGADWLADIRRALETARVAVFLVTQNFLASPFIRNEEMPPLLAAARDRGCLIFWIAVSSTTFADSPLAKIQSANPIGKPLDLLPEAEQNKIFTEIYQKMKSAVMVE